MVNEPVSELFDEPVAVSGPSPSSMAPRTLLGVLKPAAKSHISILKSSFNSEQNLALEDYNKSIINLLSYASIMLLCFGSQLCPKLC